MKMMIFAAAAAIAFGGVAAAPALAQPPGHDMHDSTRHDMDRHDNDRHDMDRHDMDRHDRDMRHHGWDRGHHYGWNHHRRQICRWYHHRRICTWRRW